MTETVFVTYESRALTGMVPLLDYREELQRKSDEWVRDGMIDLIDCQTYEPVAHSLRRRFSRFLDVELPAREARAQSAIPNSTMTIFDELDAKRDAEEMRDELLLVKLWLGAITVYVGRPSSGLAFPIAVDFFSPILRGCVDAEETIQAGLLRLGVYGKVCMTDAHLVEHENCPLFVTSTTVDPLNVYSIGEIHRTAERIVDAQEREHGDDPMTKKGFIARMLELLPRLSVARAETAGWKECVPEHWKKPGRRRRRRN